MKKHAFQTNWKKSKGIFKMNGRRAKQMRKNLRARKWRIMVDSRTPEAIWRLRRGTWAR